MTEDLLAFGLFMEELDNVDENNDHDIVVEKKPFLQLNELINAEIKADYRLTRPAIQGLIDLLETLH